MGRKFIASDEAKPATRQHKRPCSDCPWRRDALPGWLGSMSPQEWLAVAHGEGTAECHVHLGVQCAGFAIYRTNVCKSPRNPEALRLPEDPEVCFASPHEFLEHHTQVPTKKGA